MKHLSHKAIILKTTKYAEADLIVRVLTSEGQKLSLIARGALKSKKRFSGGVLEPTHYVQIGYRESKSSQGLHVLEEASIIKDFRKIRLEYERIELALFFVQTIEKIAQEGDAHAQGIFNLLGNALSVLEDVKSLANLKIQFALKLLHQQGVLTLEDWMADFLKTSIKESDQIPSLTQEEDQLRTRSLLYTLDQYTKTAEH